MAVFAPPINEQNVNTGLASAYWQPYSLTDPAELPLATAALGATWASPWKPFGATDSGIAFAFERETNEIMIEEQATQVDEVTETLTWSVNVTLAEDTLDTMLLAYGGGVIEAVAAGVTTPGTRQLTIAQDAEFISVGFEVKNELGFWRRYLIPKAKSIADVETTFSRKEDKRMYEISIRSLCPPEDVLIIEMVAEPTGP